MTTKTWIVALVVGATATAALFPVSAIAKGPGAGGMGSDRPSFSELDANGDGSLTIAEVQANATGRFAEMDANGDGVITADEIAARAAEQAEMRATERFARMLEWRDSDGDGALSQVEMGDNRAEKMFSRLDKDGDGVVSAEEFEMAQKRGQRDGAGNHGNRRGG